MTEDLCVKFSSIPSNCNRSPLIVAVVVIKSLPSSSGRVVDSTLRSTFRLLKPLLLSATYEGTELLRSKTGKQTLNDCDGEYVESGDDREDKVEDGEVNVEGGEVKVEDGEVSVGKEEGVVAPNPPENHSGNVGVPLSLCEVPFLEAAEKTLTFLRPFSEKIHQEYSESNGGGWGWSPRQAQCISMYEHKHQADSITTFPCPPGFFLCWTIL